MIGVTMRRGFWLAVLVVLLVGREAVWAQETAPEDVREARIWLDRGDEPVVKRGEQLRVYYRASHDSYVAIFHIDTDGSVKLVHPAAPDEDHLVSGGRDYRLLFPRSPYWNVDEDPGVGYYFMVASPEPFDFSSFEYARYDWGWDLTRVGRAVYEDPYLAMDDYVAALIPGWDMVPYTLDFITYNVGSTHEYPRFMCYQCHGFRSYTDWNPYLYACTDYRVVIWDDPYYYPSYRYSGTRVVFAIPLRARPRFEFTTRVVGQPWAPVVRQRSAPPSRMVQYKESPAPRASVTSPVQRRATPSDRVRSGAARTPTRASVSPPPSAQGRTTPSQGRAVPSTTRTTPSDRTTPTTGAKPSTTRFPPITGNMGRPTLQRRPSTTAGSRGSTSSRPSTSRPSSSGSGRSVSPSRGQTRSSGVTNRPTTSRPATSRPTTSRPTARPITSSGSRPTVRPPSRPTTTRARPAVRPRSGGTTARPPE